MILEISVLTKILNRLQIYDCKIGVVKCFGVYFFYSLKTYNIY